MVRQRTERDDILRAPELTFNGRQVRKDAVLLTTDSRIRRMRDSRDGLGGARHNLDRRS